ncbi:MAG: 30S ribosomal protein S17 [bacterium]
MTKETTTTTKKVKKKFQGIVVSNKATNTLIVKVERKFQHPLYTKIITKHKKFAVHCVVADIQIGDKVTFSECKPISKNKRFYFTGKVS